MRFIPIILGLMLTISFSVFSQDSTYQENTESIDLNLLRVFSHLDTLADEISYDSLLITMSNIDTSIIERIRVDVKDIESGIVVLRKTILIDEIFSQNNSSGVLYRLHLGYVATGRSLKSFVRFTYDTGQLSKVFIEEL